MTSLEQTLILVAVAAQATQILTTNLVLIFQLKAHICGHIIKTVIDRNTLLHFWSHIIFSQDDRTHL
jgi:hypothetical protein